MSRKGKKPAPPEGVRHADGRTYPRHEAASLEETVEALTAHGYGVPPARVLEILSKLSTEERYDLMYVCYRAADKLGTEGFRWAKD